MYNHKRFVALIPARQGSKGIPGKNIAVCAGKPLINWTFEAAQKSTYLDAVFCSSDDPTALELAHKHGISVIRRPRALAQDHTRMLDVLLHAKQYWTENGYSFDYVVLLQPTSPLRTSQDIQRSIRQIIQDKTNSLSSVHPVDLRAGLLMTGEARGTSLRTQSLAKNLADLPRQQAMPLYYVNGAIYIWKMNIIKPGLRLNSTQSGICLPSSHTPDIDTMKDFLRCQRLLNRRHHHREK